MKETVEHEFACSIAIRDLNTIKKLKALCDCTNVLEISSILDFDEMNLTEPGFLRILGEFGELDLSVNEKQLKKILIEGEKNEDT